MKNFTLVSSARDNSVGTLCDWLKVGCMALYIGGGEEGHPATSRDNITFPHFNTVNLTLDERVTLLPAGTTLVRGDFTLKRSYAEDNF